MKFLIYSLIFIFIDNEKVMPVKGKQSGSFSTEAWNCITWLEEYARLYAEKHPDSCHLDLPPCLTKKSVYEIMSEELHDQGVKVVTENYFISILWRKYCSHIKIPAVSIVCTIVMFQYCIRQGTKIMHVHVKLLSILTFMNVLLFIGGFKNQHSEIVSSGKNYPNSFACSISLYL